MPTLGDDLDVGFEMLRSLQKWLHLALNLGLWHGSYFHAGSAHAMVTLSP